MLSIVGTIISTLVEGLSAFLTGIGGAVVGFIETLFVSSTGTLTTFGTVLLAFMGIAVAYWVVGLVLSVVRR